ncbi:MAG: DUF4123 domain-containing protein [Pseudomonadota bacterium]
MISPPSSEQDAPRQPLALQIQAHDIALDPDGKSRSHALRQIAFHPSEQTYLIVDGALRTAVVGLYDLDTVDLPVACLFHGDVAEDVIEAAPHIIDLTLDEDLLQPDARLPRFHRDFSENHWGQNTGILIKSAAPFADIRNHLRKFTKVRQESQNAWEFFRFWDPNVAEKYFLALENWPERIAQWFATSSGHQISLVLEKNNGRELLEIRPTQEIASANRPVGPLVLTSYELDIFKSEQFRKDIHKTKDLLRKTFPSELQHLSDNLLEREVSHAVGVAQRAGIIRFENIFLIAAWAAHLGRYWMSEQVLEILASDAPEPNRMATLKAAMKQNGAAHGS